RYCSRARAKPIDARMAHLHEVSTVSFRFVTPAGPRQRSFLTARWLECRARFATFATEVVAFVATKRQRIRRPSIGRVAREYGGSMPLHRLVLPVLVGVSAPAGAQSSSPPLKLQLPADSAQSAVAEPSKNPAAENTAAPASAAIPPSAVYEETYGARRD